MEKIKKEIAKQRCFTNLELKSHIQKDSVRSNVSDWNEGKSLQLNDTIMSSRLYESNCVVLAKFSIEKVNHSSLRSYST